MEPVKEDAQQTEEKEKSVDGSAEVVAEGGEKQAEGEGEKKEETAVTPNDIQMADATEETKAEGGEKTEEGKVSEGVAETSMADKEEEKKEEKPKVDMQR